MSNDNDFGDVVFDLRAEKRLTYGSLYAFEVTRTPEVTFDSPIRRRIDTRLETVINNFYSALEREAIVSTEILRGYNDRPTMDDLVYAERRLLEIGRERRDQVVHIIVRDKEAAKMYLARQSKLQK